MNQELVREIIASGSAVLENLAKAAGSTASHLYSVLIRQQMVEGIGNIICLFLFFLIGIPASKKIIEWGSKESDYDSSSIVLFGIFFLIAVLLISLGVLQESIGKLINPEFYALKFIFEAVKGAK